MEALSVSSLSPYTKGALLRSYGDASATKAIGKGVPRHHLARRCSAVRTLGAHAEKLIKQRTATGGLAPGEEETLREIEGALIAALDDTEATRVSGSTNGVSFLNPRVSDWAAHVLALALLTVTG